MCNHPKATYDYKRTFLANQTLGKDFERSSVECVIIQMRPYGNER